VSLRRDLKRLAHQPTWRAAKSKRRLGADNLGENPLSSCLSRHRRCSNPAVGWSLVAIGAASGTVSASARPQISLTDKR
jgi:hypothetical protein